MEKEGIWEYNFTVRSFDIDKNNNITLNSISEYLQEVAGAHANGKGFGYNQVVAQNLAWILSGIRIEIDRIPIWDEEITIKSWIVGNNRFTSRRDFEWFDKAGNILLKASSNWVLLNTKTRRPQNIDQMNFDAVILSDKMATSTEIKNTREKFEDNNPLSYKVRYSDLDMVGHMNNTKYIQLMLDNYSLDFHENHKVKMLNINFKTEAKYEENLLLSTKEVEENNFVHILSRTVDSKISCQAHILWQS